MLRATRASSALIRSLLLGTAAVTTTFVAATALVGCQNENEPEYWLDKLDDAKWRPRAVERLTQFLDDALGRADNDIENPAVKALEDKLVGPLTQVYVDSYDQLDTKTRVKLIKLLADFRDPRAIPALKKAFEEFAKRPRSTTDEVDIKWAVRAYGDMKTPELAPAVLAAFEKLQAHTQLGGVVYQDYSNAMVKAPSPAWSSALIGLLGGEMKDPSTGKTKQQQRDMVDPFRDAQFWQVTSAQVLGELKSADAVEPLLKVLLDPYKGSAATTAILALVKIGKPSVDRATKLLDASDPLAIWHKEQIKKVTDAKELPSGNPALAIGAAVIGLSGRPDGAPALITALKKDGVSAEDKAVLARELTKIPSTPENQAAFKAAFESISLDTALQGDPALVVLGEAAGDFFDPGLVDWLLQRAEVTKGGGDEKKALQQTLAMTAMKVAKVGQIQVVHAAAEKYKLDDIVKVGEPMLKKCGDDVKCYLEAIEKSENQTQANQVAGIKAAYMIGVLGNDSARDDLIDRLPSIENAAVNFVACKSIDKLTPNGSADVVKKLEELIEKNTKSADREKLAANGPLKQTAYRISARSK